MSSYPTQNIEFQKNSKTIIKINNTIMASFQEKIGWEWPKNRGKKKKKTFR